LHVYLAAEAPIAVVLRRGPSRWVRLSLWHTDTDMFEHGQWFAGRVYERRCDLAPDGSLFAYFAHKAGGGPDVAVDSWAAVSRPPWFTALALWEVGTTYFAGGYFKDARRLALGYQNAAPDRGTVPRWLGLTSTLPYVDRTREWTDRAVHISRMLRDGWLPDTTPDASDAIWSRARPSGGATLVQRASAASTPFARVTAYAVDVGSSRTELGDATWADWDQRGRLVLARDGRLIEVALDGSERVIEDFNGQTPDPQPSPAWARRWPRVLSRR
jgi:hypothetical protein